MNEMNEMNEAFLLEDLQNMMRVTSKEHVAVKVALGVLLRRGQQGKHL